MSNSSVPGHRPAPEPSQDRRRLAELIGRLLARRWLRDRRPSPAGGGSAPAPTPAADDLLRRVPGER